MGVLETLAAVVALLVCVEAEYSTGKVHQTPVDLSQSTFRKAIEDPANPFWLLKFYAPWVRNMEEYIFNAYAYT